MAVDSDGNDPMSIQRHCDIGENIKYRLGCNKADIADSAEDECK